MARCDSCGTKFHDTSGLTRHQAGRDATEAELLAMWMWGAEYARSKQSVKCFYVTLPDGRKKLVADCLRRLEEARRG